MKRLVVCALLAGCGGGGNIAIDDLGHELAEASCAKQWDCCTDAEIMDQYTGITIDGHPIASEADCVDFADALLTGFGVMQWKASVEKGRLEYDGDAAADCIAAIESATCDQYSSDTIPTASDCRPFLIPKVADGGGCTQDDECTSGNCVGAMVNTGSESTDGACMPMPQDGDACDDNCADGLTCEFDTSSGMRTCQPLHSDGEDCSLDRQCASDHCDDQTNVCGIEPETCTGR
jgi:hypothetical protein